MRLALKRLSEYVGVGSIALRLAGLVSRLVLALYLASFLGFEAVATYGFVVGSSAAMIALSGLGLDYKMGRLCVAGDAATVARRIRDRSVLRLLVELGVLTVGLVLIQYFSLMRLTYLAAVPIVLLEPFCYDLHEALIYRSKPLLGNLILFLRSAAWIPVVIVAGLVDPDLRSIDVVLVGWTIGLLSAIGIVIYAAGRPAHLRRIVSSPIDWPWIRKNATSSFVVYFSELGYAGMIYGDRYIVAVVLDEYAAGVFTFMWTLTNAIVPIVQAGVFNQVGPKLAKFWQAGDRINWKLTLIGAQWSALKLSAVCGVIVIVAVAVVLPRIGLPQDNLRICLAATMCVAIVIRMRAEILHTALYSSENDRQWISVNVICLFVAPIIGILFIKLFGLIGAGLQMVAVAIFVLTLRSRYLKPVVGQVNAAP